MRIAIRTLGAEELAKSFLNRIGIKDRVELKNTTKVKKLLKNMNDQEKSSFESDTGKKWSDVYSTKKKKN